MREPSDVNQGVPEIYRGHELSWNAGRGQSWSVNAFARAACRSASSSAAVSACGARTASAFA
jgi:hypothetical protein